MREAPPENPVEPFLLRLAETRLGRTLDPYCFQSGLHVFDSRNKKSSLKPMGSPQ
jgi:hypothetical protein